MKKQTKTPLVLTREHLRTLTERDLKTVIGGVRPPTATCTCIAVCS